CNDALEDGSWHPESLQWRPNTCTLLSHNPATISTCFRDSRIDFFGDSTVRALFNALVTRLEANQTVRENGMTWRKHYDRVAYAPGNVTMYFRWEPYFNRSLVHVEEGDGIVARVIGFGLWPMRYGGADDASAFESFKSGVGRVEEAACVKEVEGRVVVRLVQPLVDDMMSREQAKRMAARKAIEFNEYMVPELTEKCEGRRVELARAEYTMYVGAGRENTKDGIHYSNETVQQELDILLNRLCNQKVLGAQVGASGTCCVKYQGPSGRAWMFFVILVIIGPITFGLRMMLGKGIAWLDKIVPSQTVSLDFSKLALIVIFCHICDRTPQFLEVGESHWITFDLLLITALAASFLTTHAQQTSSAFLNQNLTNEWKGWMIAVILIIQLSGPQPAFERVRYISASFLFMTGYNHVQSFYQNKDYSLWRATRTILRLNLLSLQLAACLETDVQMYIVGLLVGFWFLVIYVTMSVMKEWNYHLWFVVAKILCSAIVVTLLEVLGRSLNTQMDGNELVLRLQADRWAVYVGMLTALVVTRHSAANFTKSGTYRARPQLWKAGVVIIGTCVILNDTVPIAHGVNDVVSTTNYATYYSPLLALLYAVVRNATPRIRQRGSWLFCWIGKMSLEIFVLQFHLWTSLDRPTRVSEITNMADTLPLEPTILFWIKLILTATALIFMCDLAAPATRRIVDWIIGDEEKAIWKRSIIILVTLLLVIPF
ncbi:10 TM acyl transferase domain found in Cas1p-domain-containing protein, partial [Cladochytrium replicatum]